MRPPRAPLWLADYQNPFQCPFHSRLKCCTIECVNKRLLLFPGAFMRGRRGQAMIEYMIVAVMLMALVAVFALLLYALRQQSGRALDLVASEYP